jgi:hypothetical protein
MLRASIAAARSQPSAALEQLAPMLRAIGDGRGASLPALFAARAHGQLVAGDTGQRSSARAEARIKERGVLHPRRFARLFLPGLEDRLRSPSNAP